MKKIKLEEEVVIEYRDSLDLHKRNINMVYKNECKASNVLEYILENYKMHLREDNEIERYFIDKIEEYILEED